MARKGALMPPARVLQRWLWEMEQAELSYYTVTRTKHVWDIEAQDNDFDCFTLYKDGRRIGEIFVTNWQIDFVSYDDEEDDWEEFF